MKTWVLRIGFPILAGALLSAPASYANPITVNNASFETLPGGGPLPFGCGTGCAYSESDIAATTIPDWTVTGNVYGQFQPGPPTTLTYFDTVPDGITIAYTNGGSISQTVGSTVVVGVVYTLLVSVGVRNDEPDPGTEALVVNGNTYLATGTPASPGHWSTYTATYTGLAGDLGDAITIQLASPGAQGDWDNVQLSSATSASGVPEPASGLLVGLGALALAGIVRHKRVLHGKISL
jgi:hypothetical protein